MDIYDKIESLLRQNNITAYKLAKDTGFSTGLLSQWKTRKQKPSIDKIKKIAEYFSVPIDFFLSCEEQKTAPVLTKKDERDIAKDLEELKASLENNESLMFDGDPMTPEARESILAAMKLGLEAAKVKNKEKYTPKKYKGG